MPRARARRVRRRYNAVVLETNRQTGKVYCLILFCGGSPINRQARNDGSVGYCRPPLRRFALIPRQARNDGNISISFLYISNQVLLYAKLHQLLPFISYLLPKPPHHFDRSSITLCMQLIGWKLNRQLSKHTKEIQSVIGGEIQALAATMKKPY